MKNRNGLNTEVISKGWNTKGSYFIRSSSNGKTKIEGVYMLNSIPFKFSMASRESGRYPLRGTIRALDSNGKKKKKRGREAQDIINNQGANRKLDIRKDIQCTLASDTIIKECIVSAAERLYFDNNVLMGVQLESLTSPDTITPYIAAQKYAREFVVECHPKLLDDKFEKAVQKIIRDCQRLPAVPMCTLTVKRLKDTMKRVKLGRMAQEELHKFFGFCLDYGVYEGINFIEKPKKKRKTGKEKQIMATRVDELTPELQDAFYRALEMNINGTSASVALLASGIDKKEIVELKWKDLTFHKEKKDYVVIHLFRQRKLSATYDYSRPLVPRSAIIMRKYYETQKSKYSGTIEDKYVFPHSKLKNNHIAPAAVIENATRILTRIGVSYGILGQLHREDRKTAAARRATDHAPATRTPARHQESESRSGLWPERPDPP